MVQAMTTHQQAADPTSRDADLRDLANVNRRAAFDALVRRYRKPIYRHTLAIVRDEDAALDATQEVFIRAHRCDGLFDDGFHIRAWLYRVASNLCFNIVRDRKRRTTLLETFHMAHKRPPPASSHEQVLEGERRSAMLGALDELSEDHRNVLLLKYWQDLSYHEIADVLGIRLGTVMSRLSRAREKLAEVVMEHESLAPEML